MRFVYSRYLRDRVSLITEIRGGWYTSCKSNRSVVLSKATMTPMTNDLDIGKIFEFAKELTLEAGKIVRHGMKSEKYTKSKAHDNDLVTAYDNKVEEFLISRLSKKYPDHKFIGEETTAKTKSTPEWTDAPTWFIDPIDGTINFVHSIPFFAISVGLAICKQLVLGIIYNPSNSELYTAKQGEGAFLNGQPIRTSTVTELKKAVLSMQPQMIKRHGQRDIVVARHEKLIDTVQGVRAIGSAALDMCYVARGAFDAFHMDGLSSWDVAAGVLIVREAGGTVLDPRGGEFNLMKPNIATAGTKELAKELTDLIVDVDLKTQRKRLQRSKDIPLMCEGITESNGH